MQRQLAVAVIALVMTTMCATVQAKSNSTASTAIEPNARQFEDIDPKKFTNGATIDNEWWPLKPGTHLTYTGTTIGDEGEAIPHKIEFYVTDLTKMINGIRAAIVYEKDISNGAMVECELAFFAQDDDGAVWHLGQYSEMYEGTELIGGRTFLVGHLEGAKAGIMMPAKPEVGTPSYSQGYGPPPFNWSDRGRIYQRGQKTKVPAGSFEDVLITEEFTAEEPGAIQLKYYAKGVGNVRVGWKGTDSMKETLELSKMAMLTGEALAKIRAEAKALETRAYVYGSTPAAEGPATQ